MAFHHLFSGIKASPSTQSGKTNINPLCVFNESCSADKTVVFCMKILSSNRRMVTLDEIAEICLIFSKIIL